MDLSTPVHKVKQIGPKYAKNLKKLGIEEAKNLLFHFPSRYEDYSKIVPIKDLKPNQKATVQGKVIYCSQRRANKKKLNITEVYVEDETDTVKVIWFNQSYISNQLQEGTNVSLSGKALEDPPDVYFSNPSHEFINKFSQPVHTARLVPIYPETRGVSSRWLRYIISRLLYFADSLDDPLPEKIAEEKGFPDLKTALKNIHFPEKKKDYQDALARFKFEELFYVQLAALRAKTKMHQQTSPQIKTEVNLTKNFVNNLPFQLTESQKKASWTLLKDMEKKTPMNRLLEGDVGSGKTVVAAVSILNASQNGYKTAFMAPTEILAEQHFRTVKELFGDQNINIALFTRGARESTKNITDSSGKPIKNISKEKMHELISQGEFDLVIGTHTLVQDNVKIPKLAFVVIDEQHRFGVAHRASLTKKNNYVPHLLSMTATPIPRSLALTVYGDLDITLLREMPKGRKKVTTEIVPPQKRKGAYEFIKKELDAGRQAFCVFPLIEESNTLTARAAKEEYEKLSSGPFKNYNVGLLHGKMKAQEKERVMRQMKENEIQVLVSTSVVEVGIDIPNASIMMIESAERFGLAQLHQFRGRVGRAEHQSYCFLLTESGSQNTLQRLQAITKAKNGFELAEYDLKLRGPGSIYGVRQSGMPDIATESLTNVKLIEDTREAAYSTLSETPDLTKYPLLKEKAEELQETMHFE